MTSAAAKSQTPLLDKLRAGVSQAPWFIDPLKLANWRRHRDRMQALACEPGLPAFSVDQVATYFYEVTEREYWNLEDFPDMRLPDDYGACWLEHKFPGRIHSEIGDKDVVATFGGGHVGILIICAERADVVGEGIPENTQRILICELFIYYAADDRLFGPHETWMLALDSRGALIGNPWMQGWHSPEQSDGVRQFQICLNVPLLAISSLPAEGGGPLRFILVRKTVAKHP